MTKINNTLNSNNPFELSRFINAQETIYDRVLSELKHGYKQSHWMWYIFPQLDGLGQSTKSKYYAIKSREEALAYLNHPILGLRLLECTDILYKIEEKTASEIFGYPDDLKLKSSMTLFATVASNSAFISIIDKYFYGEKDLKTLHLLEKLNNKNDYFNEFQN